MIPLDTGSLMDAAIPLGVAIGIALICVVLRTVLVTRVFTEQEGRSMAVVLTRLILDPRFFSVFAFLFAFRFFLPSSYGAVPFLDKALFFLFTIHFIAVAWRLIDRAGDRFIRERIAVGSTVLKTAIAAVSLIFLFDNLGISVTTLLVVLGAISLGAAVAFRDIIANVVSAVVLKTSTSFSVGDVIAFGGKRGTILSIGSMATRVQMEGGGTLVVPNRDMIAEAMTIIDTAASTQVVITVPVPRTTPTKRIEEIPTLFEQVVAGMDAAEFRHATVASVDPTTISFEVVCQVTGDRAVCAVVKHKLAVQLLAALKQRSSSHKKGGGEEG